MKDYPLDVQDLREFDGGHLGHFSKGHHDPAAFAKAVYAHDETQIDPAKVYTSLWRCVPAGTEAQGWSLFVPARAPGRGVFPVTVAEEW